MKGISWINLILGLWLIAAPFFLGYTATAVALWEAVIIGVAIASIALYQVVSDKAMQLTGLSWTLMVLGIWSILAPFALGYSGVTAAVSNDALVGLVVAILAGYQAFKGTEMAAPTHREQH